MHGNTRHFCCCLPVRLGVFIASILGFLGSGIGAIFLWINLAKLRNQPYHDQATEITYWVTSASVTLLCIVTFIGLIGTFLKSYRTMRFYFGNLIVTFIISSILGVISLVAIFRVPKDTLIDDCLHKEDGTLDPDLDRTKCEGVVIAVKIIFAAVYSAILLLQIFIIILVQRYSEQLKDEEYTTNAKRSNINIGGGGSGLVAIKV
ncbi:hypothetical protein VNI00_002383 [Paramarasmius palmivorus]|uniref:Uncharacterized protein n=1 Tax=Paramarasmius palmivorus TaxID=297713 RepID=A0AAW0DVP1_9AGAR